MMASLQPQLSRKIDLEIQDLGRIGYSKAYSLQKQLQQDVISRRETPHPGTPHRMYLLLVEHDPPVITISRRKNARLHLLATDEQLKSAGIEVAETDRGGDITYHGPGQIVVYPILDLNVLGLRLHSYMRFLEQVAIDTLSQFGIKGTRDSTATGVWVGQSKISALGVRVSRWVSMHGLALNVSTNLDHFDMIVPCGLAGRTVTSMKNELGTESVDFEQVKTKLIQQFQYGLNSLPMINPADSA